MKRLLVSVVLALAAVETASAQEPGHPVSALQWGLPGDIPCAGDFDGDGIGDLCVWRPTDGTWYLRFSLIGRGDTRSVQWGLPGDVPMAADFDGDGLMDLAVYRPSEGRWYVQFSHWTSWDTVPMPTLPCLNDGCIPPVSQPCGDRPCVDPSPTL
jgi:hypothetical protein